MGAPHLTDPAEDLMRDRSQRMRIVATGLLVLMAFLFLVTLRLEDMHPAWGYLHAFSEAALVGGLADWFAVTALFRHPMGVPIPHTAIIPKNKDRIADTMAQFLRENFLTPAVVARRMASMNLARGAGNFLSETKDGQIGGAAGSRFGSGAADLFVDMLESLDPDRLGGQVKAGLAHQLEKMEVAPLIGQMLSASIADKRHLPLVDSIIRWSGLTLEDNEEMVRDMINQRANSIIRWTGLDERLSNSVLDGLYKLLAEVLVDPEHPLRSKIEEGLEQLANDLVHDDELRGKVERMKTELLANPALASWWQGVWERMRRAMIDMAKGNADGTGPHLPGQLSGSIVELGDALRVDPKLQLQVNRFARRTAVGIATRYGGQIVQLVSETVKRWDATTITGRIESAVGRDLQFIRVNGTLVGGLVGVTLHFLISVFG